MTRGLILIIVSAVLLISPFALPCSAYAPVPAALTFAGRSAAAAAVGKGIVVTGAGGVLGTGLAANLTKEEFFTADGVINLDTHVNFIGRCVASSSHREAFRREFLKGAKDCGLDVKSLARRRRSPILNGGLLDPFKLACITACIHKKLHILTKRNDFQRNESKLKKMLEHSKILDLEGEKLKSIVAHLALCSRITPSFQDGRGCNAALPFALCAVFGTIRACGRAD